MQKLNITRKLEIIDEYQKCKSPKIIKEKYKIGKSTLYTWLKTLKAKKTGMYSIKNYSAWDIALMERELKKLREENQIFRESGCSINSAVQDKISAIERLKTKFTIYALCRTLNLSKGTYYHRNKYRPEKTTYQERKEEIQPLILKHFKASNERFGAEKIRLMLITDGIVTSKKYITKLMKEMGITCKQNRLKCNWVTREYKYRFNKLKQNFTQSEPNTYWVSDITYVRVNDDFYGICVIIDLFSRKVLSYSISSNSNTGLTLNTFNKAYELRGNPSNLILHSDQGVQYTSFEFRKHLRNRKVKQSFSNPGSPLDNAVAEAFFSIMKREELSHSFYNSLESLQETVSEYIDFFNNKRPHRKLGNVTPTQFEINYQRQLNLARDELQREEFLRDIIKNETI